MSHESLRSDAARVDGGSRWGVLWPWASAAEQFIMGTTRPDSDFAGRWMRRIYAEAFRRMEVPLEVAVYPTQRLSLVLEAGTVDGEMARGQGYAAAHPTLIRVEEPVFDTMFLLVGGPSAQRLRELGQD